MDDLGGVKVLSIVRVVSAQGSHDEWVGQEGGLSRTAAAIYDWVAGSLFEDM